MKKSPDSSEFQRSGALLLLALIPFVASPAHAQTTAPAADGDTVQLPAFSVSSAMDKGYLAANSVSATRVDTPIKNLPFAVSAFTDQFIGDVGARDLYDVVKFSPGVTIAGRDFVAGNTRYAIRGFDQLTPQRNGFVGTAYVDATNIQRVEVVKGPASVLYGQISPGGTVNYITKRPEEKSFLKLKQSGGDSGYLRSEVDANLATLGHNLLVRVNSSWENAFEEIGDATSKTFVLAPSVTWRITKNSSLTADFDLFRRRETAMVSPLPTMSISLTADTDPALTGYAAGEAQMQQNRGSLGFYPLPRDFNYVSKNDYRDIDFRTLNLEYDITLGEHWKARANYNWNTRRMNQKLTGIASVTLTAPTGETANSFAGRVLANPEAALEAKTATLTRRKRYAEDFGHSDAYQVELAGAYDVGSVTLKPLLGVFRSDTTGRTIVRQSGSAAPAGTANADTTPAQNFQPWNMKDPSTWDYDTDFNEFQLPIVASGGNTRVDSKDTGYYAVLAASAFSDKLQLVGGARYNETESTAYDYGTKVTTPSTGPYKADKVTPQVGVGYRVQPSLMFYASYSESFAVTERTLQEDSVVTGIAKPTTASGYDVGMKTDFFHGRLSSTISYFYIEQKDRVLRFGSFNSAGGVLTTTRQGTEDLSRGVELEFTLSPTDNWQIYASYAYTDVKLVSALIPPAPSPNTTLAAYQADPAAYTAAFTQGYNDAAARYIGSRPEATAKDLFNLWTRYTFKAGALNGFWVGGGANYTGNKQALAGNLLLFLPAYTTYDLAAGYDWKDAHRSYSIQLNWKNVTDKEYIPANQLRGEESRIFGSFAVKF